MKSPGGEPGPFQDRGLLDWIRKLPLAEQSELQDEGQGQRIHERADLLVFANQEVDDDVEDDAEHDAQGRPWQLALRVLQHGPWAPGLDAERDHRRYGW